MAESKAKSEPAKESEAKREAREPRALSSEYHKARKQLMLWAAILFIWELVGVDLDKAKEAGGNAGAIIGAIKSPQAVPWVLLILVAYFLFKLTVEWYQCTAQRRTMKAAIVDFRSAWLVAFLAFALYVAQTVTKLQLANLINYDVLVQAFGGASSGLFIVETFYYLPQMILRAAETKRIWWRIVGATAITFLWTGGNLIFIHFKLSGGVNWTSFIIGLTIGGAIRFLFLSRSIIFLGLRKIWS